jgi:hypothetical protein
MTGFRGALVLFLLGWLALAIFRTGGSAPASPAASPASPSGTVRVTDPDILRQQNEAAERERLEKMAPAELAKQLQAEMEAVCQAANPGLNYIKASRRGAGLYCVHDFYSRYSMSSGPLAPLLNEYASRRSAELKRLKITRIGAWGTGEYASGSWIDLR